MINNDRIISYELVSPKNSFIEVIGDFQKIALTKEDFISVMPAYFRNYGSLENELLVRITINKKYSFESFSSVTSKEFGSFKSINHEWLKKNNDYDALLYTVNLQEVDVVERKNRILRDTINIKIGDLEFKFTPKRVK